MAEWRTKSRIGACTTTRGWNRFFFLRNPIDCDRAVAYAFGCVCSAARTPRLLLLGVSGVITPSSFLLEHLPKSIASARPYEPGLFPCNDTMNFTLIRAEYEKSLYFLKGLYVRRRAWLRPLPQLDRSRLFSRAARMKFVSLYKSSLAYGGPGYRR